MSSCVKSNTVSHATGGARVTTWLRTDDDGARLPPSPVLPAGVEEVVRQVAKALESVTARHVLVIAGPGTRLEVTPLVAAGPGPGKAASAARIPAASGTN